MMEFSFNTFFGYENLLNDNPEMLIFGAMLVPILLMIPFAIIGWIFRKLKLNLYSIQALFYTLLFTFFLGTFTVFILFFITDKNGVKLTYCWLSVFVGMLVFSFLHTNTLNKMFTDWSKIIKK